MTLILLQVMIQSVASTLYWVGLYVGIRALPGEKSHRLRWTIGSAAVLVVWLVGVMLLAANDAFRIDTPGIPVGLLTTLAAGYLLLLSRTFRAIISGIPQHWLIGIQTFRMAACFWCDISKGSCRACSRSRQASATSSRVCLRRS